MKAIEHETWTEYEWEVGDLVRLKENERMGLRGIAGKAGEWGRVTDTRDGYLVTLILSGYARGPESLGNGIKISRYALAPWERRPEDEPGIRKNVVALLKELAFACGTPHVRASPGIVSVTVPKTGILKETTLHVPDHVVAETARYLGTGSTIPSVGTDWAVNAEGQDLLDAEGMTPDLGLAGGGNRFEMRYTRRGAFVVHDRETHLLHRIEGQVAAALYRANRKEVGVLHDGRMPDLVKAVLSAPTCPAGIPVDRQGRTLDMDDTPEEGMSPGF